VLRSSADQQLFDTVLVTNNKRAKYRQIFTAIQRTRRCGNMAERRGFCGTGLCRGRGVVCTVPYSTRTVLQPPAEYCRISRPCSQAPWTQGLNRRASSEKGDKRSLSGLKSWERRAGQEVQFSDGQLLQISDGEYYGC